MENIDRLEKLLRTCSYAELSAEQRMEIKELVSSEEEYEALRLVIQHLEHASSPDVVPVPSSDVLSRIKRHVRSTAPVNFWRWWSVPVPSYATAAIVLAVGIVCWWAGSRTNPRPVLVEKSKLVIDTVYVASRPDTVFVDRVVYVPKKETSIPKLTNVNHQSPVSPPRG